MTLEIINLQDSMQVPEGKIRELLRQVMLEELDREVNVSVAVVTDERIAELNRTFRNETGPTDVLAFPFGEKEMGLEDDRVFGEIVISAERARHEARLRHVDAGGELILYAVHGMLHLAGYDDRSAEGEKEMRRRETEVLGSPGSSNGGRKES